MNYTDFLIFLLIPILLLSALLTNLIVNRTQPRDSYRGESRSDKYWRKKEEKYETLYPKDEVVIYKSDSDQIEKLGKVKQTAFALTACSGFHCLIEDDDTKEIHHVSIKNINK